MITQKSCMEHEGNISDVKRDQWTWTWNTLGVKVLGWTNIQSLSINNPPVKYSDSKLDRPGKSNLSFHFNSNFTIHRVTVYLTQKFLSQFTVEMGEIRVVSFS